MKLSREMKIGLGAMSIVVLLLGSLMIFSLSGNTKTKAGKVSETTCPDCGGQLNKIGECPKCIAQEGLEAYRAKRAQTGIAYSPVISIIVVSLLCLLTVVYIGILVHKRAKNSKSDVSYYVRCQKCGRKLRYRDTQVGHIGRCPLCQKPIRFPRPAEESKMSRWTKIAHYVWR